MSRCRPLTRLRAGEGTLLEVYRVSVHTDPMTRRYRVIGIPGGGILLHSENDTMRLGHSLFDAGEVFEDGVPVSADSIRIGDEIEVTWDGMVMTSYPGQFGYIFAVRVVGRTDTAEYLGVVKENLGDSLLVYFSGADRVDPLDSVNDIALIPDERCLRVTLTGVTVRAGADAGAGENVAEIAAGDRVWVSYTGEGFENAPSEACAVSQIIWYKKHTVTLTVCEILEHHVRLADGEGRYFTYHKTDRRNFQIYENDGVIAFHALRVGDRLEVDYGGDVLTWGDGQYSLADVFVMRVIERARN